MPLDDPQTLSETRIECRPGTVPRPIHGLKPGGAAKRPIWGLRPGTEFLAAAVAAFTESGRAYERLAERTDIALLNALFDAAVIVKGGLQYPEAFEELRVAHEIDSRVKRVESAVVRIYFRNIDDSTVNRYANAVMWFVECAENRDRAISIAKARGGMRRIGDEFRSGHSNNQDEDEYNDDDHDDVVEPGGRYAGMGRYHPPAPRGEGGRVFHDAYNRDSNVEWYTPKFLFDALECQFDLDPASPGRHIVPWIPVDRHYTSNGLEREWPSNAFVWLNPPYGRSILPNWITKFTAHGNGIALVPDRSSTVWWQELASHADLILFMNQKIPFVRPNMEAFGCFPIGHILVAIGDRGTKALRAGYRNGLGLLMARV
jgi:hypothetical protein